MADYETKEGVGVLGGSLDGFDNELERAHKLHHLATADPEPERGIGTETGPAHEKRFGLERAEDSAEKWRAVGVHPYENRALRPGDEGYDAGSDVTDDKDDSKTVIETGAKPPRVVKP